MSKKIELDKKVKKQIIENLISYVQKEHSEKLGNLSAELFLDFLSEEIGKHYYNKGINDAIAYMANSVEDLKGLEKY